MKTLNALAVALAVCAITSIGALGCNTFRGAGKDIQSGGHAVENAADNAQHDKGNREVRQHSIMASAEAGGSINPSGSTSVPYGASRTFTVNANGGYHVADVLVDGKSVGAVSRYTFTKVTTSHTISASFSGNPNR
ncbi:MAG: entericidin A/B family lipoprotein [Candidatus Hydrogenedentes bacterium]|nr:entericidin A/B family lipoprotein [Candidatus Hydrogenedentota bacterium]